MTIVRLSRRYIVILLSLALLAPLVSPYRHAQSARIVLVKTASKSDKVQLHQVLLDLGNPWTVMCVAAHPDDEDGSTLTVLRRKYGVHTVSLFSTYGEGGQNAVGQELYEELGVIRARETMAASEVQGSEPYFLGLRDFGFSKSAEEAFRVWGEREALRRMVLKIRQLRPDVIITNHDTTSGHGHHQATGRLILQAFDAAADPKEFPEQLTEVTTWQAQRLFVRARGPAGPPSQAVTVDPNEVDPVRGISYAQQALNGLQKHATQGPWPKAISPNGARIIRYNLVRAIPPAGALPENPKTVVDGLKLPEAISSKFVAPTLDQKPLTEHVDKPGEVLVALVNARKRGAFTATKEIEAIDPQRFRLMSKRLDNALAVTTGVQLTIEAKDRLLVPGVKSEFEVSLSNTGDSDVAIKKLSSRGLPLDKQLNPPDKLLPGTETSQTATATPAKTTPFSVPSSAHLYDGRLFGESLSVTAEVEAEGAPFTVAAERRLDVGPAVQIINNNPSPCVETTATIGRCLSASLTLVNNLNEKFSGELTLTSSLRGRPTNSKNEVALTPHESRKIVLGSSSQISARALANSHRQPDVTTVSLVKANSKELVSKETIAVVYVAGIAVAGLRVGYVPSYDDTLKQSLHALGVKSKELNVQDVQNSDLAQFDTVIIDNRGYEAHPELIQANGRLLKFVENGGTMIVLYHKTNEWNTHPQLGPQPIVLGDDRVTEEDAPIQILEPRHSLFNFPNRITQTDFADWIQERGLYFPRQWDPKYTALLSTHDKGESPLKGGLLVSQFGNGNYVYTSLVWYRQLRAGIPGGYRFFANLISYGHQGMAPRMPGTR